MSTEDISTDEDLLHSLFEESLDENEPDFLEENPFFENLQADSPRYYDHELIASGGMKNIFKVFDKKTGRHVALARLKDEIPVEAYEALLLEARLTSLLEHPNIISVHDIGLNPEQKPYFTMELKVGDSLREILRSVQNSQNDYVNKFDLRTLLTIFIKICDAVSYAHSRSVVHLDLKPSNIQIGAFGEVKVCDWGLGKVIGNTTFDNYENLELNPDFLNDITLTGQIKGTLGFMSPEQLDKKGEKTFLSDIYALGAILHTILYLAPPISGGKEEMIHKTKLGEIEKPDSDALQRNVPEGLVAVSRKAMSTAAQQRYQTVAEMRREIDKFLSGFATQAENASLLKEVKLFVKRNKMSCTIALTFLLTAIIGTSFFVHNLNQSIKNELYARELAEKESERSRKAQEIAERESQKSLEAMLLYEDQQQKTEKAIQLYETEKNQRNDFLKNASRRFMIHIYKLTDFDVYTYPVQSLELALKTIKQTEKSYKDATPEVFTQQKSYIYLIQQKFQLASEASEQFDGVKEIVELSLDLPVENDLLIPEAIPEFFKRAKTVPYGHFKNVSAKMLAFDGAVRENIIDHSIFVRETILHHNYRWDPENFHYDLKKKHLKINGKHLINLGVYSHLARGVGNITFFSFLTYLKPKSLDLSNSHYFNLSQLQELELEELNISKTLVTNLEALQKMARLKKLIISYNQFPEKTLRQIPEGISVEYVD